MTALERTVALAEMDGAPAPVTENLDFDVARLYEQLLQVHRFVAKGRLRLHTRRRQRTGQLLFGMDDFMPRPPPPADALTRIGSPIRRTTSSASPADPIGPSRSRHHGQAEACRRPLGRDLVAHQADVLRPRANEMDTMFDQYFSEARIFGEKPVARMHGIGAGDVARRYECWNV